MTAHDQQKLPRQTQNRQPGRESEMIPKPAFEPRFRADKLKDKVALITSGDSGIGRSVAVYMAREGAEIAIIYLEENEDAVETARFVEAKGRRCLIISGDVSAAEQHVTGGEGPLDIPKKQLQQTFQTNIFGYFQMSKAVLTHMTVEAAIVNTASVTAYKGKKELI